VTRLTRPVPRRPRPVYLRVIPPAASPCDVPDTPARPLQWLILIVLIVLCLVIWTLVFINPWAVQ